MNRDRQNESFDNKNKLKSDNNVQTGTLKSVQLKKIFNNYFLVIKVESQGKEYVLSNPFLSDPVNFRKQFFGILTACNCYDLLRLSRKEPIPLECRGYYFDGRGYKILENKYGQWFLLNKKSGIYACEKADEKLKEMFQIIQKADRGSIDISDGSITSITSQSGVLQIGFLNRHCGFSVFLSGQVYFGFGFPLNREDKWSEKEGRESAKLFKSFITSLMEFYGEKDLLKLGGEIQNYPKIEITLDNNRIKSITNSDTKLGLIVGKSYEIGSVASTHTSLEGRKNHFYEEIVVEAPNGGAEVEKDTVELRQNPLTRTEIGEP